MFSITREGKPIELTMEELEHAADYYSRVTHLEWIRSLVVEQLEDSGLPLDAINIDEVVKNVDKDYETALDFDASDDSIYDIIRENIAHYIAQHRQI